MEKEYKLAEQYHLQGNNCIESVLKTCNDTMNLQLPDVAIRMASGMGGGIGRSGCVCGALSGACLVIGALVGRFLVCPACVLVLLPFIPVTPMSAQVFTMQASMPAMTQMTVVSKSVGADVRYSTEVSFITVVMGIVIIPLYMFIIG